MKIELYYAPVACSLVPYVTLTEAKADFTVHPISLRSNDNLSPEYRKLNPKHKVPLLVVDGQTLTENTAIQIWIARNFPEAGLLPSDPWQEVQAISVMAWCAAGIHPYLTRVFKPGNVCKTPGSEESVTEIAKAGLAEAFSIAEGMLPADGYFFDHFTAADAYFFWCFRRAQLLGVEVEGFEKCMAHFRLMSERESVKKVLAYEAETLKKG